MLHRTTCRLCETPIVKKVLPKQPPFYHAFSNWQQGLFAGAGIGCGVGLAVYACWGQLRDDVGNQAAVVAGNTLGDHQEEAKKKAATQEAGSHVTLEGVVYRQEYCLSWAHGLEPDDHQKEDHGSCFLMAPVIVRHQLQLLNKDVWPPGHRDIPEAMQELHHRNPDFIKTREGHPTEFTGGVPLEAFKVIVSSAEMLPIKNAYWSSIVEQAKRLPSMLPYLPTPPSGPVVVLTPEQLAAGMHTELRKVEAKRQFHSQAVVGVMTNQETGAQYFCARQTWVGSQVTLVPIMTVEDILAVWNERGLQEITGGKVLLEKHHCIVFPTEDQEGGIDSGPLSFSAGPATFSSSSHPFDLMQRTSF